MKKLTIAGLALTIIFSACSGDSDTEEKSSKDNTTSATKSTDQPTTSAVKKYEIKSGIINFETTIKAGSMTIVKKSILYFDDYGNKEAREELNDDGTLEKTFLSDGKNLILLVHAAKESYNQGAAYQGTEFRYDGAGMVSSGKGKKVDNINVAGKDCDAYEYNDANTKTTTVFAGYKNVTLYTKQGEGNITKATKIEEDVPVPAEKFTIPAGYTAKTM